MHKVFLKGFVFGLGLAVAFAIAYVAYQAISPSPTDPTPLTSLTPSQALHLEFEERDFSDLSIEEQIARSSVVFVARFEEAEDGRLRAVVAEVLKESDGAAFQYQVGDEYHRASVYPKAGVDYGTGVVVFLTGANAEFTSSASIHADRVFGLGNMPLEMFRRRCSSSA